MITSKDLNAILIKTRPRKRPKAKKRLRRRLEIAEDFFSLGAGRARKQKPSKNERCVIAAFDILSQRPMLAAVAIPINEQTREALKTLLEARQRRLGREQAKGSRKDVGAPNPRDFYRDVIGFLLAAYKEAKMGKPGIRGPTMRFVQACLESFGDKKTEHAVIKLLQRFRAEQKRLAAEQKTPPL